jgi:ubiquinone/menaquinone biosynthesis C-methylase UbiE
MKIYTAERTNEKNNADNPILQRLMFAYYEAKDYIINKDVLEIGCGEGYGAAILSEYAHKYVGVDKYKTQNTDNIKGIDFIQMKVPYLTGFKDNSFDVVVSFQVIEHIQRDDIYIKEIYRVLKQDGIAILTTPNIKMSLTRNPFHVREYNIKELETLLSKTFNNVKIDGVFGDKIVMEYYKKNKEAVKKITRYDILNLQYKLPLFLLKIPYNIFNRINRLRLANSNNSITTDIKISNYYLDTANDTCLDFFCILKK